jgi:protein-S-isoprenylcysteine O-methyltransferase Ste14
MFISVRPDEVRSGIFLVLVQWAFWRIFAQIIDLMAQKKNTAAYWLLFFVSTAAFIFACAAHFEYLTLIIPFVATSFVKAMDIM